MALPGSETAFFEAIARILPPDRTAAEAAASKFLSIAMPLHGLGVLEEDLIRIANGVQPMSDDKDGFTLHKRIQGGVDFPFVVGIE